MVWEPNEMDLLFDAAGWIRNDSARRYECIVNGEVIAAMTFAEAKLIERVDGLEFDNIFQQATDLRELILSKETA